MHYLIHSSTTLTPRVLLVVYDVYPYPYYERVHSLLIIVLEQLVVSGYTLAYDSTFVCILS